MNETHMDKKAHTKEAPEMVEITRVEKETPEHITFYFKNKKTSLATPGQFLMVWLPRIDEKPISFSQIGKECAITVQNKGVWSSQMGALKAGGFIGIRGPYGKGFDLSGIKKAIIVVGGCGSAPLRPLLAQALEKKIELKTVLGAQTKDKLLCKKDFQALKANLAITTDDGSEGEKGFVTIALEKMLSSEKPDCIFCCGPEAMMKAVFDLCEKKGVKTQMSLERYMKCGYGICGQCALDDLLVCRDGPVFSSEQLRKSKEFGKIARIRSGKEVTIKEYAAYKNE